MARLPIADRRRQFIDAAVKVISAEGVSRATTRRIAEEAGSPAASLHYCFRTKDDLLRAAYEAGTSDGLDAIGNAVKPKMGVYNAVDIIVRELGRWIRGNPEVQLAQYELTMWSFRSTDSRHLGQRVYRRWVDECAQILRESIDDQDPPIDVDVIARMLIGTADGQALQWLALGEDRLDAVLEHTAGSIRAYIASGSVTHAHVRDDAIDVPPSTTTHCPVT